MRTSNKEISEEIFDLIRSEFPNCEFIRHLYIAQCRYGSVQYDERVGQWIGTFIINDKAITARDSDLRIMISCLKFNLEEEKRNAMKIVQTVNFFLGVEK